MQFFKKTYSNKKHAQFSNLVGVVSIGVQPVPNAYVSPYTHYINVDITNKKPAGYTLFGVFGNSNGATAPMTYSMGVSGSTVFLRVWAMDATTRGFNLVYFKNFKDFT